MNKQITHMSYEPVEVFWCRLPAFSKSSPFNHHFIAFISKGLIASGKVSNGYYFATFSVTGGDMKLHQNVSGDTDKISQWLKGDKKKKVKDLQLNRVISPFGSKTDKSGRVFASKVINKINIFNKNINSQPMPKTTFASVIITIDRGQNHGAWSPLQNCATVVNSVFKAAGVSSYNRKKCGEFDGIDWGEEAELNMSYFR